MSAKKSAEINTGFPIYGIKFLNNNTVLAVGGGGEGNNGIPNKITAIRCSFSVKDKNRRLQKFREITLPSNEDSPMCIDTARVSQDDAKYSIFVGCNQSTQLIKSMNMNNNLRKYIFTDEEHLRFFDAVQFDDSVPIESVGEYPKIVSLSPEGEVGAFMTSKVPSEILVYNPESLELLSRVASSTPAEIKDFQVNPFDTGNTIALITASSVELVKVSTNSTISSSAKADKKTTNTLAKYFLSKVRFVSETNVILTGAFKSGKGSAILEYDTKAQKIVKETTVSKKVKGIVAIDYSRQQGLIAVAGNDFTITLIRQSDFKILTTISKLHKFAITSLSFSPNGKKLATGSASNTLNVLPIPPNFASGTSFLGYLFQFFVLSILVCLGGIFLQQAHESGQLAQYIELGKKHGGVAYNQAQDYGKVALELSQKYGSVYLEKAQEYGSVYFEKAREYGKIGYGVAREKSAFGLDLLREKLNRENLEETDDTKQYFTMSEWIDNRDDKATETATTVPTGSTLNDIVHEVTEEVNTRSDDNVNTESLRSEAIKTKISLASIPSAVSSESIPEVASETTVSDSKSLSSEPAESPSSQPSKASESQFEVDISSDLADTKTALAEVTDLLTTPSSEISKETPKEAESETISYNGTVKTDVGETEESTSDIGELENESLVGGVASEPASNTTDAEETQEDFGSVEETPKTVQAQPEGSEPLEIPLDVEASPVSEIVVDTAASISSSLELVATSVEQTANPDTTTQAEVATDSTKAETTVETEADKDSSSSTDTSLSSEASESSSIMDTESESESTTSPSLSLTGTEDAVSKASEIVESVVSNASSIVDTLSSEVMAEGSATSEVSKSTSETVSSENEAQVPPESAETHSDPTEAVLTEASEEVSTPLLTSVTTSETTETTETGETTVETSPGSTELTQTESVSSGTKNPTEAPEESAVVSADTEKTEERALSSQQDTAPEDVARSAQDQAESSDIQTTLISSESNANTQGVHDEL